MKKQLFIKFFFLISVFLTLYTSGYYVKGVFRGDVRQNESEANIAAAEQKKPVKKDRIESIEITAGSTYGALMATAGIAYETAMEIYQAAKDGYDLVRIREGKYLELIFDKDSEALKQLKYKIDTEEELFVTKTKDSAKASSAPLYAWEAEIKKIPYEIKTRTAEGKIETSLYQAAIDRDIDIRAIIELANAFQWSIDFAMDPRLGDKFKFIFEERYLDGEYIMPGKILAGKYVNAGEDFYVYYFEENKDNTGFFDENGNSVQKMFLRAPVAFKYISSGFTTGPRYVGGKYQTYTSSHMAIDYAAPAGTPIRAVGDGIIVSAGWNSSGYGYMTSIRHNGTYTTNYAHQSKILVKTGQRIKQGETIGKVGSTGFSTGPHLHYEMVKNGSKINPLKEVLPPGKPIKEENRERFFAEIKKWQDILNN